jgi:hypothetical protein
MWIEAECRISADLVRTYRGKIEEQDFQQLISDQPARFLKLQQCYWYNLQDGVDPRRLGSFERLGEGTYLNFIGDMYLRSDTVINFAPLRGGYDNEPSKGNVELLNSRK